MRKGLMAIFLAVIWAAAGYADARALLSNAQDLVKKGLYPEAVELLQKALEENPSKDVKFDILTELAEIQLNFLTPPQAKEAVVNLMEAKALFPENYRKMDKVYYLLGIAYMKLGRYVDAAKAFETVATKFRRSPYLDDALTGVEEAFKKNFKEIEAIADDEPITKVEVDARIEEIPPLFRQKYESEEGRKELIENMINEILTVKEAEARKLYLKADVMKQLERARRQILSKALYDEVTGAVTVSDKEIEKYYRKFRDVQFKVPARVTVRRIVVKTRKEAEEILDLLKKGAAFDSLAKARSITPDAQNGGFLGILTKESRPKEIVATAFKLKEGEISGIIETDGQYTIIKVEKKEPEHYRDLESVKNSIANKIRSQKAKAAWEAFLKDLRKKYGVKYPEDLQKEMENLKQKVGKIQNGGQEAPESGE